MARKSRIESLGKPLGPLEEEIMEFLWSRDSSSGKDVFSGIRAGRDIALTTVLTVLERLANKGLVSKAKAEGVYSYSPVLTRDEFAKSVSEGVLKGIMGISASGLCASFVDALAESDPDELEHLSALIEKKKKELGVKEGK